MSDETAASLIHKAHIERQRRIAAERTAPEPTPEQIKAYLDQESRTVDQQAHDEAKEEVCADWVALHPEYKKSSHSGAMMEEFLNARGLQYTGENLDAAFVHLSSRGLIETNAEIVDGKVRTRAQNAELQRRADNLSAARTPHTREELEAMPMEELRARALGIPYVASDWF